MEERFYRTCSLRNFYFKRLQKKISNNFKIKIIKNKFYKGNLFKKQNHFYFLAKRIKN